MARMQFIGNRAHLKILGHYCLHPTGPELKYKSDLFQSLAVETQFYKVFQHGFISAIVEEVFCGDQMSLFVQIDNTSICYVHASHMCILDETMLSLYNAFNSYSLPPPEAQLTQ